jgi:hypothetical protein
VIVSPGGGRSVPATFAATAALVGLVFRLTAPLRPADPLEPTPPPELGAVYSARWRRKNSRIRAQLSSASAGA